MKTILFVLGLLSTVLNVMSEEITVIHKGNTFTVNTSHIDSLEATTPQMKSEIIAFMHELKAKNIDPLCWQDKIQEKIGDPNADKFYCRLFWKIKNPSDIIDTNELLPDEFLLEPKGIRANRFKIAVSCYADGTPTTVQVIYKDRDKVFCVAQSITLLLNFGDKLGLQVGQCRNKTFKELEDLMEDFERMHVHPDMLKYISTITNPHTEVSFSYLESLTIQGKVTR